LYDDQAEQIAALHANLIPCSLYNLIERYFLPKGACADIGCGIGRDSAWLAQQGYSVIGVDASEGMLHQARLRYPHLIFRFDSLPELVTLETETYANLLCSAVLMHLPETMLPLAISNLLRVTTVDGTLIISFRGSQSCDYRENGKLYNPIDVKHFIDMFTAAGGELLLHEVSQETGRELSWHNFIFRKLPHPE
jgi:2-polyprenyl-3-methyl-5-hydroxy-6-metoxy-1,4-benzoquinol methylase